MEWLLIPLLVLAAGYIWYATIISRRNQVLESLGGIDVQLNKRHDLIPNILTIARRFMEHERELLQSITELRGKAQAGIGSKDSAAVEEHLKMETELQARMERFFALAEGYPQLKSDSTMLQAQRTYNEVEEHIAAARRFYNAAVASLNNAIQIFPGGLFASFAGVSTYPFYEAPAGAKAPISAADYLQTQHDDEPRRSVH